MEVRVLGNWFPVVNITFTEASAYVAYDAGNNGLRIVQLDLRREFPDAVRVTAREEQVAAIYKHVLERGWARDVPSVTETEEFWLKFSRQRGSAWLEVNGANLQHFIWWLEE